ncbi:MAG TPA: ABC transporter substrate-binding protein, partial [Solirubrobacterales bacterium]|nr:ABC transporter substrate-binding protein [Solirubrobacterales bacterium]
GQMTPAEIAIQMAVTKGYFHDVGLTVFTGVPVWPRRPVSYVAAYTDDIAVAQQPQVALAKDHGAPIVAVGSLISQPTAALIWLKGSGIRNVADLKGKTVASPGIPYQDEMLESILEKAGVNPDDVEVKHVNYHLLPALLHGQADAIFGGSSNVEGVTLRKRGLNPVIKRVQELGVPSYDETMIVTRADRAAREPQVVRKFMAALERGVAAVRNDPRLAAKVLESSPHEFRTSKGEMEAQVRATLPLLSRTGSMDSDQAARLLTWMHEEGMIQRQPPVSELFTDEYLSGRG